MQTFIAILRGINVNGKKIIKMDKLKDLFVHLNFKNVKTYIQSGNIVFQSENIDCQDLEKQVQQKILSDFDFDVPTMVKSKTEWQTVAKNNPFIDERAIDITKLHVTFLSKTPEQGLIEKIEQGNYGTDQCIIIDKTVYLFCPNGYGNTKLSNNFFENKLKITATTRNWKTVNELLQMTEILFES